MNNWLLGLLIWMLVALCVCLFNYGASLDRKGGKRVDGSDRPGLASNQAHRALTN
jgi:hypothetical protein